MRAVATGTLGGATGMAGAVRRRVPKAPAPGKLPGMARSLRVPTFVQHAGPPRHAVAMLFDLEGFSKFFNQPDVQRYVPKYLNHTFGAVAAVLRGGSKLYWLPDNVGRDQDALVARKPVYEKFLGDGALYLWVLGDEETDFPLPFRSQLLDRLWQLKAFFGKVVARCTRDVPVYDLPSRIRFGLAGGTVYELTDTKAGASEYVGVCINLASRLQKYCPDLGFIASARMELPLSALERGNWKKVVAKGLRGFPKEIVIVDTDEYEGLDENVKEDLFMNLENG